MGHFVANVSELQLQPKCLGVAFGNLYRVFILPVLFDESYEHTNPNSRQVLWPDPIANGKQESSMENH